MCIEEEIYKRAADIILKSNYLIALTGSGISAESGIPTFRGKNGLWKKYRPEELATPEAFFSDPVKVWEWYNWRIKMVLSAKPNSGHYALTELEKMGLLKAIITQNVDDLHERSGAKNVIKLHGHILRARCIRCNYVEHVKKPYNIIPPKCKKCGSLLRPDVVWFGEPIPHQSLIKSYEHIEKADVILVIGTSALVMPAGSFPYIVKERGGRVIEINPNETPVSDYADISIRERAGIALPKIVEAIRNVLGNMK